MRMDFESRPIVNSVQKGGGSGGWLLHANQHPPPPYLSTSRGSCCNSSSVLQSGTPVVVVLDSWSVLQSLSVPKSDWSRRRSCHNLETHWVLCISLILIGQTPPPFVIVQVRCSASYTNNQQFRTAACPAVRNSAIVLEYATHLALLAVKYTLYSRWRLRAPLY